MTTSHTVSCRQLRSQMSEAERLIWRSIRKRQIKNARFRRQHPIGCFIVDFACVEYRLIIELDGGQHGARAGEDRARSAFLQRQGWTVIRFWNNQVFEQTESVLEAIAASLVPPP